MHGKNGEKMRGGQADILWKLTMYLHFGVDKAHACRYNKICSRGSAGIGRQARAYGFKSHLPHQTNIIRTCSSLWETGSDYLFSWIDTKAPVSATGCGESRLLNQEGRRRRKRPNKRKKGGCSRLHGASALCVLTFCLSASFGGKCVSLGKDSSDIALWVAKNLVDLVLDF